MQKSRSNESLVVILAPLVNNARVFRFKRRFPGQFDVCGSIFGYFITIEAQTHQHQTIDFIENRVNLLHAHL